jgi:AraC family transcriptional regulator, transcriptional activator of pobA
MKAISHHRIKTITEYHRTMDIPGPVHPLISVIDFEDVKKVPDGQVNLIIDFYSIALKRNFNARMKYGQQEYDFDEGIMTFMAPGQVLRIEAGEEVIKHSGRLLLVHPDFLWNTPLASKIGQYEYFDYAVNEALYLSEKEEGTIMTIIQGIQEEYHSNTDKFSQAVITAQIELMLTYAERYYYRQFMTRKISNHQILDRMEHLLNDYFNSNVPGAKGTPTVQYIAEALSISPNYLSGLLKSLTGQSTQQHIHDKLIEKAKEKLSTTDLSVSEIAYELGFEHSQSFSKLFKSKTNLSPLEFRHSFN